MTRTPREWAVECMSRLDLNCPDVAPSETVAVIVGEAIAAERDRCLALVKRYWTFSGEQIHTHTWHDLADCLAALLKGNPVPPPKPRGRKP